jgi:hypothetical protein
MHGTFHSLERLGEIDLLEMDPGGGGKNVGCPRFMDAATRLSRVRADVVGVGFRFHRGWLPLGTRWRESGGHTLQSQGIRLVHVDFAFPPRSHIRDDFQGRRPKGEDRRLGELLPKITLAFFR